MPVRIALASDEIREFPVRPGLSTVTRIHVSERGNSVWSSLARPDTEEYQTDVYGDELTSAESLAQGVMRGNVVTNAEFAGERAAVTHFPVGLNDQDPEISSHNLAPEDDRSRKTVRQRTREMAPESNVPPRSPDLGSAYFPLSPAIGPGSSRLGPAAGPHGSRRRFLGENESHMNGIETRR